MRLPFTLTSISITRHSPSNSGISVAHTTTAALPKTLLLEPGQSESFELFAISTPEQSLDADDYVQKTIEVVLEFSAPEVAGTLTGVTGSLGIGGFGIGYVNWSGPLVLPFGDKGLFTITLSDAVFGLNHHVANVFATMAYEVRSNVIEVIDMSAIPASVPHLVHGARTASSPQQKRHKK